MSSLPEDLNKLKVVDLRAELTQRGLDSKGNKPVLVKRLRKALQVASSASDMADSSVDEAELDSAADVSIGEEACVSPPPPQPPTSMPTSVITSPPQLNPPAVQSPPPVVAAEAPIMEGLYSSPPKPQEQHSTAVMEASSPPKPQQVDTQSPPHPQMAHVSELSQTAIPLYPVPEKLTSVVKEIAIEAKETPKEKVQWENGESDEISWEPEAVDDNASAAPADIAADATGTATEMEAVESGQKGEKRKRSPSPSPNEGWSPPASPPAQRPRSRSPIKEDEPVFDSDKIHLSWYDSDLHLQIDKESLLSAKPYYDGIFGYAWAGVRATHGVSTTTGGKVCFEVKITEKLPWVDNSKHESSSTTNGNSSSRSSSTRKDHHYHHSRHHRRFSSDRRRSSSVDTTKKTDDDESATAEKTTEDDAKSPSSTNTTPTTTTNNNKVVVLGQDDDNKMEVFVVEEDNGDVASITTEEKATAIKDDSEENVDDDDDVEMKTTEHTEKNQEDKKVEEEDTKSETSDAPKTIISERENEDKEETSSTCKQEEKVVNKDVVDPIHIIRIGWSLANNSTSGLQLGEDAFSYAYESTGKGVTNKEFVDFGMEFGVDDVVTTYLDLDDNDEEIVISYAINGVLQSNQHRIQKSTLPADGSCVFFPHICSRNYAFEVNFGGKEDAFSATHPQEFNDFTFIENVDNKIANVQRPENRNECEVILMVGLPSSGKSHWVKSHIEENADKKYTVLGVNKLIDNMTLFGKPLKAKYSGGRWCNFVEKVQRNIQKLIDVAVQRRRNFIIDQTNVYSSEQRRTLRPFDGYKKRTVVVVVVSDEEQSKRESLGEEAQDSNDYSKTTVLTMKASMTLPQKSEWVDEIIYAGLDEADAKIVVAKYNKEGGEATQTYVKGYTSYKRDDYYRNRKPQPRYNDYHGGGYRDRQYYNRYDYRAPASRYQSSGGGGGGGHWQTSSRSSNWNRDSQRRDYRGSSRDVYSYHGSSGRDRNSRDSYSSGGYNNRNSRSGGGSGGSGASSGGNRGWNSRSGGSGGGGGGGHWSNQSWGSGGSNQWSGGSGGHSNWQNQNQWKYGDSSGHHGRNQDWSYYGQYGRQNWNQQ